MEKAEDIVVEEASYKAINIANSSKSINIVLLVRFALAYLNNYKCKTLSLTADHIKFRFSEEISGLTKYIPFH